MHYRPVATLGDLVGKSVGDAVLGVGAAVLSTEKETKFRKGKHRIKSIIMSEGETHRWVRGQVVDNFAAG